MHLSVQVVLAAAAVGIAAGVLVAALALRRAALRAEGVLAILEQELRPLVGQLHALLADLRSLSREAHTDLERVGIVTERVDDLAAGLSRTVGVLAGLTRVGQLVGVAAGLKKGFDVFVHRVRKDQGDNHE
jgi:hypothetical protein